MDPMHSHNRKSENTQAVLRLVPLAAQQQMQCLIFPKSPQAIREDIHQGKSEHYGSETFREILKLLPKSEKVKKLKTFNGNVSKLSLADSFLYGLIQVTNYLVWTEATELKKGFLPSCSSLYKDLTMLRTARKELLSSWEYHECQRDAGNTVGFKPSSLRKLVDTIANKPGINLLHFVTQEAQKQDTTLLHFSEKLQTKSPQENIQRDQELAQQMEDFPQFVIELELELQGKAHSLLIFFLLKELEQKRHSWTIGELGGFGRSSSENNVEMLAKKGTEELSSFLKPRPTSPPTDPPTTVILVSPWASLLTRPRAFDFLEGAISSPEDPNKFSGWSRPTIAWMEPSEQKNHDPNFAHEPQASKKQEKALSTSPSPHPLLA
ncbi:hypothetical protein U0070_006691 [Myodes glareolus]|uniref:FH2 domain-containing protein n=1 Tax=Myodes glareolus TaxID=447135 RepID=A0AAW0H566_MYOGA